MCLPFMNSYVSPTAHLQAVETHLNSLGDTWTHLDSLDLTSTHKGEGEGSRSQTETGKGVNRTIWARFHLECDPTTQFVLPPRSHITRKSHSL